MGVQGAASYFQGIAQSAGVKYHELPHRDRDATFPHFHFLDGTEHRVRLRACPPPLYPLPSLVDVVLPCLFRARRLAVLGLPVSVACVDGALLPQRLSSPFKRGQVKVCARTSACGCVGLLPCPVQDFESLIKAQDSNCCPPNLFYTFWINQDTSVNVESFARLLAQVLRS
jgi:hypothetical protein